VALLIAKATASDPAFGTDLRLAASTGARALLARAAARRPESQRPLTERGQSGTVGERASQFFLNAHVGHGLT
jgi:hypothetical protein